MCRIKLTMIKIFPPCPSGVLMGREAVSPFKLGGPGTAEIRILRAQSGFN